MANGDLISLSELLKYPIRADHYDKENGNEHFIYGIETVLEYAQNLPRVDAEPVRQGRCRMCNIKETGHGVIACYDVGWEVCINRSGLNYYMAVNHDGSQINFQIDFCPYCGAKMDKEE